MDDWNCYGMWPCYGPFSGHMTDLKVSDFLPLDLKGTKMKDRHPDETVVSERKISYQILIYIDIQIKVKGNPSLKSSPHILCLTQLLVGWD